MPQAIVTHPAPPDPLAEALAVHVSSPLPLSKAQPTLRSHPGPVHAFHSHHMEEETQWGRGGS